MNDQQWPLVATAEPDDRADEFSNPEDEERYVLFLEQTRGQGEHRITVIERIGSSYSTREQARSAAYSAALGYKPEHPLFPQSRVLYQVSPDSYVVGVGGLTSVFYFKISVAERIPG